MYKKGKLDASKHCILQNLNKPVSLQFEEGKIAI